MVKPNQRGFAHILLVFLFVLIFAFLGFAGWRVWNTKKTSGSAKNTGQQSKPVSGLQPCGSGPVFDAIPMALDDFKAFRPLGFVTIPIHIFGAKHSNFSINLPNEHISGKRVVFPANAVVTNVVSTSSTNGSGYQLTFYPCKEFKSYLFHLGMISEQLKSEYDKSSPKCQDFTFDASGKVTKCEAYTNIKVKSGDLAGTSDSFGGVDWGAVDYRITNQFDNLDRYDGDYPHYTSPILYLRSDLKAKMLKKVGSYDGHVIRTAEPVVGTLMQDVKGTAQGNWFLVDKSFKNTQDFSPFMALLHDYIDPAQPEFAMGTSVKGLAKGLYSFKIRSVGLVNRDFKDVKSDGQVYCYGEWASGQSAGHLPLSTINGVILLSMPDDKKLRVEYQPGTCAVKHLISDNATTFDR